MNVLEAQDLSVTLGANLVLRQVDLRAQAGRITGLIGPNGAGKSTLLRALLRLQAVETGRIRWAGADITTQPSHKLAGVFAYLAQSQTVHWPLSVEATVALARQPSLTPFSRLSATDHQAIDQALAVTELTAQRRRAITQLSGGERARALVARVLASDAPVIMADEPVAALDPYHQLNILGLLRAAADAGRLVIMVLHDLGLARRYCDDVVVLDAGAVAAAGPADRVLNAAVLEPVYRVRLEFSASGAITPLAGKA